MELFYRARTRDEITTKVVNNLFRKFKNARELAQADIEEIKAIIYSIGFFNIKAKRIKDVWQLIVERFNGEVPDDMQKLLELPGAQKETRQTVFWYMGLRRLQFRLIFMFTGFQTD